MEELPKDIILCYNADTLVAVRKEINLDSPQRINEALDILQDWIKKQDHFIVKDYTRGFLERTLMTSKGSVERAKQKIDKMCTFRTLLPEFFISCDPKTYFQDLDSSIGHAHLPKLTKDHCRVYIMKMLNDDLSSAQMFKFYVKNVMLSEYIRKYEYCCGFHIVVDVQDVNIINFVTKINPIDLRNLLSILIDGFGMRMKGIHLITASKLVDTLVGLLKQVLSPKLGERIYVHKTLDTLYKYVSEDILPVDLGGTEKSLKELREEWLNVISSEEFIQYYKEMQQARTDESCRRSDKFNQEYIGTPGSFRALIVD